MKLFPEADSKWTNNKLLELILVLKIHITLQTHNLNRKKCYMYLSMGFSNYFIEIAESHLKVILWDERPQIFLLVSRTL
jgi:hypothetical protein